ncbi:hypothetical protein EVAR_47356_1 [Eumeta japonica]|uniref:Uncharacterized protein n=1 Tax=Eumeta variegata TaxID=151549 RepID=A0A4C1WWI8_EUMVA|nr:hypothetical protein EVAR_47356_1 [Eumeta japonica]
MKSAPPKKKIGQVTVGKMTYDFLISRHNPSEDRQRRHTNRPVCFNYSINDGLHVLRRALRTTCKDAHSCQHPAAYVTIAT